MGADQSPPKPWIPGQHPGYRFYRLVVNICEDELGRVWSDHEFLSDGDAQVALESRNGGAEQIAHALLLEALRREAFVDILVKLSQEPELLAQLKQPENQGRLVREIERAVTLVVSRTMPKMLPGVVRGVLDMILQRSG